MEKDEQGKIRASLGEFETAFKSILRQIKIPDIHADPSTFKTNPVTPGVGSLVISGDEWGKRWAESSDQSAGYWEERTLTPSANPIERAIAANKKRIDRLAESEKKEKWLKTMKKRKVEDFFEGVQGAGIQGYKNGIAAKKAKALRRFNELQPKVLALKQTISSMSDATDSDREKRMLAARKGMLAIGESI